MLFSRESYYSQMVLLQDSYRSFSNEPKDKKLLSQTSKAESMRNEYEKAVAKLNGIIELFDTDYRKILNNL